MSKLLLFLLPLLVVVGVFLETPNTFAASAFDDYVNTTSQLTVRHPDDSPESTQDITTTYLDIINDPQYGCRDSVAWQTFNTLTELGYGITVSNNSGQLHIPTRDERTVLITMDLNNNPLSWHVDSHTGIQAGSMHTMEIGYHQSFGFSCTPDTMNIQRTISTPPQYQTVGGMPAIFYSTVPLNYPGGYEGESIPDTIPIHIEPLGFTPNFVITKLLNYKLEVYDSVYFTFDPKPFVCEDELSPIIDYKLQSITTPSFVLEGIYSPTVPLYLDLLNDGNPQEYRLTGKYRCPDMLPTFSESSFIEFEADVNGNLYQNFIKDCFVAEFPGLDFDACMDNFRTILGFMGFRITGIQPERFVFADNDCHTLRTLHTWLNLDNNIICKQFPDYVRNVVTPFVSFAVGLMTLKFIASRRRDDL